MNWRNVKLIFAREVRDQLRDRRTLFMIAVLPLLLYPLLGMSFLQVAQFLQEHPMKVLVVGMKPVSGLPPLVVERPPTADAESPAVKLPAIAPSPPPASRFQFAPRWAGAGMNLDLLEVELATPSELQLPSDSSKVAEQIRDQMQEKQYDVVV